MNFQEIIDALEKENISKESFGCRELPNHIEGIGDIEMKYHIGGEDQGSAYVTVYHFITQNVYIKLVGYYSSYDGANFDSANYKEVFPKERVVTSYE